MRTIIISFFIVLFASLTSCAQDQNTKIVVFAVKGNCDECKKRIEDAADIKGVKLATWDEAKQVIAVTYKADKVTPEQIQQAIAGSGHDAGKFKASETGYNKLPDCCKYRDKDCQKK